MLPRVVFALLLAGSTYGFLAPVREAGPPGSDKVAHALIFTTLALAGRWTGARAWVVGIGLAVYGALVEVVQSTSFIGRDGDVRDWLADVTGVAIGLALCWAIGRARRRRRTDRDLVDRRT